MKVSIDTRHDTLEEALAVVALAFGSNGKAATREAASRRETSGSRRRAGAGNTAAPKATVKTAITPKAPPKRSTTRKAVGKGPTTFGTGAEPGTATKAAASKAPASKVQGTSRTRSKSVSANRAGLTTRRDVAKKATPTTAKAQPLKPHNVAPPGQSNTIRAWARSQGMQVADAGRMSAAVITAYNAQHN